MYKESDREKEGGEKREGKIERKRNRERESEE